MALVITNMVGKLSTGLLTLLLALAQLAGGIETAAAQVTQPLKALEGVGLTEHPDAALPLDAQFTDEQGRAVKLGDYFDGTHPVILNLAYFNCPMLCSVTMSGMVSGLKPLPWSPGQDFKIVSLSFDPRETPTLAAQRKDKYITMYERPSAGAGWSFLTGTKENIDRVTNAVGFSYKWDPVAKEYAHPEAIYVITPGGRISRYLYGIEFQPQTLKLALLEASQGKIGTTTDRILLYCYHYDAATGRYAPLAVNIMKLGAVATLIVLAVIIGPLWALELRKRKSRAGAAR